MFFDGRGRYYRLGKRPQVTAYHRLEAHKLLSSHDTTCLYAGRWQWSRGEQAVASLVYIIRPDQQAVELRYSYGGEEVAPYPVRWSISTPTYGGQRYWWLCPSCGRRCAYLYSGKVFACRQCYRLTYESAQSGDPHQARVERRMRAIRRRLGGAGGLWEPLPEKPPYMHLDTYLRLCWEYEKLEQIFWGELSLRLSLGDEQPELATLTEQCWADYQRAPTAPPADLVERILAHLHEEEDPPVDRRRPVRRTIAQTAKAAEIPVDFAREAQQEGLLRPDAGRTARRKRYRPKVASWLAKLHTLRQAGYTWEELHAWAARRFTPGHELERRWPAGYAPTAASP
jgi:hypothetical protein